MSEQYGMDRNDKTMANETSKMLKPAIITMADIYHGEDDMVFINDNRVAYVVIGEKNYQNSHYGNILFKTV